MLVFSSHNFNTRILSSAFCSVKFLIIIDFHTSIFSNIIDYTQFGNKSFLNYQTFKKEMTWNKIYT